ncbi:MAG TPA: Spy/CpxP family protein refolding chaperone [Terriglobales bacterium]|nr:Spy/CpxP family protein refolding chaperone [Terriglobales bacterium]
MNSKHLIIVLSLFLPIGLQAQMSTQQVFVAQGPGTPGPKKNVFYLHQEMGVGTWWQDSQIAHKLQLTDNQITQLNQIFTQHRLNLHSGVQEEQKANQALENLLATEQPDDEQVNAQVDQVLAARNKLQREFTTMNVDFRKVLTLEQWNQLKSIHQEKMKTMIKTLPGPGGKTVIMAPGPDTMPGPMMLPAPPPDGEN